MQLDYEQFAVQSVRVDLRMWPGLSHSYRSGELSALYAALNTEDLFENCELRATLGARFTSEHWTFDIDQTEIWVRSRSFVDLSALQRQINMLLSETRKFLGRRVSFLFVERVFVWGMVPERKDGNVAEIVKKKLLKPLKDEQTGALPGLEGAGVKFIGNSPEPDEFHWHLELEPVHGTYHDLRIGAELFWPPYPDSETDDLDVIDTRVATAYDFLRTNAKNFAKSIMP